MKFVAATLGVFAMAAPLAAHPHIFVDTGLDLYFDADGTLSKVKVRWSYDAFYSLLITQDMGLDMDGDSQLTDAEKAALQGFDMNWSAGFNGDLEVFAGGVRLPLSGPRDVTASFGFGRITTVHTRDVTQSNTVLDGLITIRPYDATYYTAYDVTFPVTLHGIENCEALIQKPEETAATKELLLQLNGLDANADPADLGLSNAGSLLATTVIVQCAES